MASGQERELTGYSIYHEKAGPYGGDVAEYEPLVTGGKSYGDVDDDIIRHVESFPTKLWLGAFGLAATVAGIFFTSVVLMFGTGLGTQGINSPVGWGIDIINFVFWIGIGHAGTLISAILYLFRQTWRTAVNRSAEAMTIFAVATAGTFPLLHVGRPWFAYWLIPIPNGRGPLWVNFNSPLVWDLFAISTYGTVSIVFWYVGLVPDLATVRDRAKNKWRKRLYGVLSLGWNGSNRAWQHYESVYLLLAGLATPLVFSVHTIVSFDFATSVIPGWHATIFPPYFVIGAIFSGFGMVLTLMIIMRKVYHLEDYITLNTIESMCKIVMLTGMLVGLAYSTEFFMAWYSGSSWEGYVFLNRAFGPYGWSYFIMFTCNAFIPQIFWFKSIRRNITVVFIVSIFVNIGMWFERYVIIVTSL
ncbi:MAG: NrfD/PsrC family molybdoenzyme membrane anchor subunit, partial [Myxococcota bacterium]